MAIVWGVPIFRIFTVLYRVSDTLITYDASGAGGIFTLYEANCQFSFMTYKSFL